MRLRPRRRERGQGSFALPIEREDFSFRCDTHPIQLAALRAWLGIGGCQMPLEVRNSMLLPVLPEELLVPLKIWLCTHEDQRANRRVRLLLDHLAAGLAAWCGGRGTFLD